MKTRKLNIMLTTIIALCSSCNKEKISNESDSINQSESESESEAKREVYDYVNLFEGKDKLVKEQTDMTKPRITINKTEYEVNDSIVIEGFNLKTSADWVGLYPRGGQPGGMDSLCWANFTNNKATLDATMFENETEYVIYLCYNGVYTILDYKTLKITRPLKNYEIENPKFAYDEDFGDFTVAITPKTTAKVTYEIYWAKDNKRLEDYTYIKTFEKASNERFTYKCGEYIYMPEEANQVEVYVVDSGKSYFTDVGDEGKLKKSKYLYSFNVINDLHPSSETDLPLRAENIMSALNNIYQYNRDSKALVVVGDEVNIGTDSVYQFLMSMMNVYTSTSKVPTYYALGNHEYIDQSSYTNSVNLFTKYTKMAYVNYTFELEGSTCIVFGSNSGDGRGTLSSENVEWIETQLENANKDKPIYVFYHQPLIDTTAGSYLDQDWYGFDKGVQVKNILAKYKNVFCFTGHTHWEMESLNNIYRIEEGPTYINGASVGYLWNDFNAGEPGSEGLFVDVYEGYLVVNGREFVTNKWLSYAQYCFPFSK